MNVPKLSIECPVHCRHVITEVGACMNVPKLSTECPVHCRHVITEVGARMNVPKLSLHEYPEIVYRVSWTLVRVLSRNF